ncbi:uncharacterized protein LOC132554038 [Ylistrum balloti]|uniref:uncharacterized protein LOC132554038 n=1 Tax=Ylistrum balloti TaxID=509963 RepID=UPI002905F682|nr:uncharacterized protein LOC132554038 [Ylistrum balloti]
MAFTHNLSVCILGLLVFSAELVHSVGRSDYIARFFVPGSSWMDGLTAIEDQSPSYYYNPCYSFNIGSSKTSQHGCHQVAVCQFNSQNHPFVDVGHQEQAVFGYGDDKQVLYINYNDDTPVFNLFSPCACYNGCRHDISVGAIFCVVFICLVATYLVVGMLYRQAVHRAMGLQLLPNLTFWTSLPGLIKDGYLFFVSPCWTSATRDVGYEQLLSDR